MTTVWVTGQIIDKIRPILAKNIKSVKHVIERLLSNLDKKYHKVSFKG